MQRYGTYARELDRLVIQEDLGRGETVCIDCGEDITECECNLNAAS